MSDNISNLKKKLNKSKKPKNIDKDAHYNTFINVNAFINPSTALTKEERERRLALAEKQTEHIIYREKELLEDYKKHREVIREMMRGQLKNVNRGQIFAFIIILLAFVFSAVFAYLDKSLESIVSFITALGIISYQFVDKFQLKSNKELKNGSKTNNH